MQFQAFISDNPKSSVDPSPEFIKESNKELNLYTSVLDKDFSSCTTELSKSGSSNVVKESYRASHANKLLKC